MPDRRVIAAITQTKEMNELKRIAPGIEPAARQVVVTL